MQCPDFRRIRSANQFALVVRGANPTLLRMNTPLDYEPKDPKPPFATPRQGFALVFFRRLVRCDDVDNGACLGMTPLPVSGRSDTHATALFRVVSRVSHLQTPRSLVSSRKTLVVSVRTLECLRRTLEGSGKTLVCLRRTLEVPGRTLEGSHRTLVCLRRTLVHPR